MHHGLASISLYVCLTLLLGACGGSETGGNIGGGGDPGMGVGGDEAFAPGNISGSTHQAAVSRPKFGSVTQGSNAEAGITTDSLSISFVPNGAKFHPIVTIDTNDGAKLASNPVPNRLDIEIPSDSGNIYPSVDVGDRDIDEVAEEIARRDGIDFDPLSSSFSYWPQVVYEFDNTGLQEVSRTIQGLFVADVLDESIGDGTHTRVAVSGLTDYPTAAAEGADDYLSWGYWIYMFLTPSDLDLSVGAFADGVETRPNDVPVTGTARYFGYTYGVAGKGVDRDIKSLSELYQVDAFEFVGDIKLTADFSTSSVTGQASGFVLADDICDGCEPGREFVEGGVMHGLVVSLGEAPIASGTSHFEGHANASGFDVGQGRWGGQFFGTRSGGEAPPAIGGTWGITQGKGQNDWKLIAGFGAWGG